MMLLTFCIVVAPAEAATDLKITSTNLYALQNEGTWKSYTGSGGELLVSQSAKDLYLPYQKSIWVNEIGTYGWQAANFKGESYGDCVSFVKTLSQTTKTSWIKGRNVVKSKDVKPGTVIATFSGSSYSGHAAIFRGYEIKKGKIVGIKVWDQNWVGYPKYRNILPSQRLGLIGRHSLTTNGTTKTNKANNYYVVKV